MSYQQSSKAATKKASPEPGPATRGSAKDKSALKGMSFAEGEKARAPEGAADKKKDGLSLGDEGSEVTALQLKLKRMWKEAEVDADFKAQFNPGKIDGKFGAKVAQAVRAVQSNNNLPLTGIYDAATAAALDEELSVLDQMKASME